MVFDSIFALIIEYQNQGQRNICGRADWSAPDFRQGLRIYETIHFALQAKKHFSFFKSDAKNQWGA